MKTTRIIAGALIVVVIAMMLAGCAGYGKNEDGTMYSWGFLRDLDVKEKYYESGVLKEKQISTKSTTSDLLLGFNELIDTTVDTASKVKP